MATNDFLSQFKLKRLLQSILFNLMFYCCLIVIVGVGFFFLYILMNYTN